MQVLIEAKDARNKKINKIEEIKTIKKPIALYNELENICAKGYEYLSDEDKQFFLKCFGIFDKGDDEFMIRVRVVSGHLTSLMANIIGQVAKEYGKDYIDITTRSQIELRYIKTKDLPIVLKRLEDVGITTFQTGIDNFRNIVTSAFDGISYDSFIECSSIIDDMNSIFLKKDEWIGTLPRKFNTAILGTTTNDCNIYGHDCAFVLAKKDNEEGFLVYLGGKVGIQAQNTNIFVKKNEVVKTYQAIIEIFKEYGFRDNRNKNRLYYLLESVGIDTFVEAIEQKLGYPLQKYGHNLVKNNYVIKDGIYNLQNNKVAIYLSIASGIFSGSDMIEASMIADKYDGFIRLCVEQSLYIIADNIHTKAIQNSQLFQKYRQNNNIFFYNQVACAGTKTCHFAVIPNKEDAIALSEYLYKNFGNIDGKIRFYWSACPKGCGLHGIGDIGFEGCKAKDADGNSTLGVHIYIGGKATKEAKEAILLYKSVPLSDSIAKVEKIVQYYISHKLQNETFEEFFTRVLEDKSTEEILSSIA